MADVKWIKIVTDVFDDEKILLIESLPESDGLIVIWFKLLCLAGKQNNNGVFLMNNKIPYTEEMLAAIFRRPLNTVKLALQTFENFGMIEVVDGVIVIPNWDKHQSLDKLEMAREKTRERVAKHREKQKQIALGEGKKEEEKPGNEQCNVTCNSEVTLRNANREDKIRIDKIRLEKRESTERKINSDFSPPTLDEVLNYAKQQNEMAFVGGFKCSQQTATEFFCHYDAIGWVIGNENKTPIRNWQSKLRLWALSPNKYKTKQELDDEIPDAPICVAR